MIERPPLVAIIDADTLIYLACYNRKDLPMKSLRDCQIKVDSLVHDILFATKATHYCLYLTEGKCFRYQVYPEYKEQRKLKEKPAFFLDIKRHLIKKWSAVFNTEFEADDLCMVARRYCEEVINMDSVVVTTDKDLKFCMRGMFYDPDKTVFINTDADTARYNFWVSMVTGDTADNIKGIPGSGPVTASKLLVEAPKDQFSTIIWEAYKAHFGEEKGIDEFYKNYRCLKIFEYLDNFTPVFHDVPEPEIPSMELDLSEAEELQDSQELT